MAIDKDYLTVDEKPELTQLREVVDAARALSVALPQTVGWDEYDRLFGVMVDALAELDNVSRETKREVEDGK